MDRYLFLVILTAVLIVFLLGLRWLDRKLTPVTKAMTYAEWLDKVNALIAYGNDRGFSIIDHRAPNWRLKKVIRAACKQYAQWEPINYFKEDDVNEHEDKPARN
jgi:hypothetical protein